MWMRLGDLAELTTGYSFRGKVLPDEDGDLTVLQIKDLNMDGRVDAADALRIRGDRVYDKHLLRAGDVLFQSRGMQNPAAVLDEPLRAIAALGVHIIRPRPDVLLPAFLVWYLNQPRTQLRLRDLSRGSTVPFIAKDDAMDFHVPVPPLAIQQKVIAIDHLLREEQRLAARLDELRNEYIYNLMRQTAASNRNKKG